MTTYTDFLAKKRRYAPPVGFAVADSALPDALYPFQRAITRWAIRRGRAAIFADCGLGKTPMQLAWADAVARESDGRVLILAPLAVAAQTMREGDKFGIAVTDAESTAGRIEITNYERLHRVDPSRYTGIVLDESSIIKAYDSKTRMAIMAAFAGTPYKLACTATPAPNDHDELGNHAEFMGQMSRAEMLSMFFINDMGESATWRLKGHAIADYWRWVASWALMIRRPSDLGFSDGGFILPELRYHSRVLETGKTLPGRLLADEVMTMLERRAASRATLAERCAEAAAIANESDDQILIWCELNDESALLTSSIRGAVEIKGSDNDAHKKTAMMDFAAGKIRALVTKPSIAGFGMNWQNCARMVFVGLSDSYEQYYQATRRCWRFGQTRPVDVYVCSTNLEGAIVANIKRKERDATTMAESMVGHMAESMRDEINGEGIARTEYTRDIATGDGWTLHLADCIDAVREIPDGTIDYSIFSPPFASLYTYSASDRDMGNAADYDIFSTHFGYLVTELYRVVRPGRLLSFHCMNLPTSKQTHGYIGIRDFRGDLIRAFQSAGFIFHSEVCIWKDPVTAMQRTKALGLLYKQLKKDSAMSRQGIPDYLVTMRKPGVNDSPVTKDPDEFSVGLWQNYASPVWMDINQSGTLQRDSAREQNDEKHICPLQLEVIRRAVRLWTNPGDLVLTPFAGIGSELVVSLELGRRAVGVELKPSYFRQAVLNCQSVVATANAQPALFEVPA